MAIDLTRVIEAAAEAVVQGQNSNSPPDRREKRAHGPRVPRTFLIGAGLVVGARLMAARRGRDLLGSLQKRLIDYEAEHFGAHTDHAEAYAGEDQEPRFEEEDEEPQDEEPQDDRPRREPAGSAPGSGTRRSRRQR